MSFRAQAGAILAVLLAAAAAPARADTVTLKDGSKLEGLVIMQTNTKLALKTDSGMKIIPLEKVDSVVKSARPPEPERDEAPPPAAAPRQQRFDSQQQNIQQNPAPRRFNQAPAPGNAAANATVKIFATVSAPDVHKPWTKESPKEETCSGLVIEGNRILTVAHPLLYATDIRVGGNAGDVRTRAKVIAIDPEIDVALLEVSDAGFFDRHAPVNLDTLGFVGAKQNINVHGYRSDSPNVVVYRYDVTSIDYLPYDARFSGPQIKLNSEIPASMCGGPAMNSSNLAIGIVGRGSHVIPGHLLGRFLKAASSGPYRGLAYADVSYQSLENPALRDYLGLALTPSFHGVLVTKDSDPFLDWDIVTQAGRDVDERGTVDYNGDFRIDFRYLLQPDATQTRQAVVFRKNQVQSIAVRGVVGQPRLIPYSDGAPPSYFIFGPIVFETATTALVNPLSAIPGLEAYLAIRGSPLATRRTDKPETPGEQLVVVPSPFFPSELVRGYDDPQLRTVKAVNGTRIRDLGQLVGVIRDSKDEFVTIEFYEKDSEILVFSRQAMIDATESILSDNNIREQGSPDAMAAWNSRPAVIDR